MSKRLIVSILALTGLVAIVLPSASASAENGRDDIVPFSSDGWSFYRGAMPPAEDWVKADVSWPVDTAPFGFGRDPGAISTTLPNDFTRKPLASYFQKEFTLDAIPDGGLTLTTWADDGVIAFVNGREALRENLPSGQIKANSYAVNAPQSKNARNHLVSAAVPRSDLRIGTNRLSVQVQSNWRATFNSSFDARLTAIPGNSQTPSPSASPSPTPTPTPSPTPTPTPSPTPTPTPSPTSTPPPTDSGTIPTWGAPAWRDEFTYIDPSSGEPEIDDSKWNVRGRDDLGVLFDAAVPSRDEVSVDENGVAHLRAEWLTTPAARGPGIGVSQSLWHKTSYMDQRALRPGDMSYAQQYGRWEIRAKVPTGPKTYGALAAFWLRNSNSGEIDIMEAWGYNEVAAPGGQRIDTAATTIHTQTSGNGNEKYIWTHADYGAATPVWDDFHTYAFELTPTYAAIYCDGVQLATATPADHPNLWNPKYFGSPLHVRLNLHVGPSATYWGLPDPNHRDWTQSLDYQVDYVRIWKYQG